MCPIRFAINCLLFLEPLHFLLYLSTLCFQFFSHTTFQNFSRYFFPLFRNAHGSDSYKSLHCTRFFRNFSVSWRMSCRSLQRYVTIFFSIRAAATIRWKTDSGLLRIFFTYYRNEKSSLRWRKFQKTVSSVVIPSFSPGRWFTVRRYYIVYFFSSNMKESASLLWYLRFLENHIFW